MTERAGRIIFALTLAAGVLTGCAQADERADVGPVTPSSRTIPFELYTHCGIDEARIGSTYFEAHTPSTAARETRPRGGTTPPSAAR